MESLYLKSKEFLFAYLVLALLMIDILFCFPKSEIHIFINSIHAPFFDRFFLAYTHVGDGYFALFIVILLLFYSLKDFLFSASSFAISGFIVGVIKRAFFYGEPRPLTYFSGLYKLYIVPGLEPNEINSFPSGHSASAFAIFLCLALIVRPRWIKYAFFFAATLVCYSRLYLSEHFLLDVFAGSLIGLVATSFVFIVFSDFGKRISEKPLQTIVWELVKKARFKREK